MDTPDTRGQITLPVDGTEYVLRPSYEAIMAIERITRRSLYELAGEATQGRMSCEVMAIVCAEMMRAFGKANPEDPLASSYRGAKPEALGPMIYEAGGPKVCARLAVVLIGALTGGYDSSGEAKAVTGTTT